MVSRYGVSKEGTVGVAVGVGPMHCLLPHCGGPHHHHHHHLSAPHPAQNPQAAHNHHVHPAHPPPPSPSPHLNHQLSHHQLTVNINHLGHQQQQQQQTQHQQAPPPPPPQYRVVTANSRSDFHVPGQSYGTQPGGQVGGGGGTVGVSGGGRGPPSLGGIQSIGQSAAGIPPSGPAGGQAPPQAQAPGVQSQQPQGPAPTTTPPVHTPSPQEMGKQAHLQTQPPPLPVYMQTQTRPTSQGYYPAGPRPQQPRGLSHRGGQGNSSTQVVGMPGVGGGGGQPAPLYQHPSGLPVQSGAMYSVPGLHAGPHQQSAVYSVNNQIPINMYGGPPQRHQSQSYYQFPIMPYGHFPPGPAPQQGYFFSPHNAPINLSRASAGAVGSGPQHVGGPLAGAQGPTVVPQGTLQQPTQQPQLSTMGIPLSQPDVYPGHNLGAMNTSSTTRLRKTRGQNAILDIVNPETGKNICDEIYCDNAPTQSGDSSNRETPQSQNNSAELLIRADFAARVAKVASEETDTTGTPVSVVSTTETTSVTSQHAVQTSISNVQPSTTSNDTGSSQCNATPSASTTSQSLNAATSSQASSVKTTNASSSSSQIDSNVAKVETKPLQPPVKEFQPRGEVNKAASTNEESSSSSITSTSTTINKDNVSSQTVVSNVAATTATAAPVTNEVEVKSNAEVATSSSSNTTQQQMNASISPLVTQTSTSVATEIPKPSTAPSANPVPAREPFPNLSSKTSSSSPPRRKPQTHLHNQSNSQDLPPSAKEQQKERKSREKSLSSRGATPTPASSATTSTSTTPVHPQPNPVPEHHHQKANGDASCERSEPIAEVVPPRNEVQQKSNDGKAMQKQKNKNKLKPRELNRKGAEKEGTDMDAFVPKTESKTQDNKETIATKDSNKESVREITKDIKEKDNYESKKEKEKEKEKEKDKEIITTHAKAEKQQTVPDVPKENAPVQTPPVIEKLPSNKEVPKEAAAKIEDNTKSQSARILNMRTTFMNDVVDHAKVVEDVEAIVAQKNEENSKVSALRTNVADEKPSSTPLVIEKQAESETTVQSTKPPAKPAVPTLKYTYKEDQWSPINKTGKKVYDRDFLMKLMDDPQSKIKPANLPDMEVVLKDNTKPRAPIDLRSFAEKNMGRSDNLYPIFAMKSSLNSRAPPPTRKSHPGKPKAAKPNVIHVSLSLREDVKLRETENAWRPTRFKHTSLSEEEAKTEALYKKVRSVLNKLTPQKFNTLIEQVRALTIDTEERLQGVINLVFEKAVDEPSYSVAYALMCKELGMMQVRSAGEKDQDSAISFKKLILDRCQKEFEKNVEIDEDARAAKLKEIEECTDMEKKKELQLLLEEEERRIRIKSVGNMRFIGELYKLGMLTTRIMHRCIKQLLDQIDEDSLECMCKLFTTIGKDLESKQQQQEDMQQYFSKMQDIVTRKGHYKISSRIRFMLQDVIDLRQNGWVPRRDDTPKTIDQIEKEAESERLNTQLSSNTLLNTPRKDDRNLDRKRNRGPTDDGWSQPVGRPRQQAYSVETAKLKNKPPPMDDLQLGSRNAYMWKSPSMSKTINSTNTTINSNKYAALENMCGFDQDKRISSLQLPGSRSSGPREYGRDYKSSYDGRSSRNGSHYQLSSSSSARENSVLDNSQNVSNPPSSAKPTTQTTAQKPMTNEQFDKALKTLLKEDIKELSIEEVATTVQQTFDTSNYTKLIRESINSVLEKSPSERERVSKLISYLIKRNILWFDSFKNGFSEVLEFVDDLIIDIPKIWTYLVEILMHPIEEETIKLADMKDILLNLKSQGHSEKLLGEILLKVSRSKGPKWVADKWDQSGLQLNSIIDSKRENIDKFIKEYNLEFLTGDYSSAKSSSNNQLDYQQIHEQLKKMLRESNFDEVSSWITANVGNRVKEPKFIRILMTAILQTSIEPYKETYKLNIESLKNLQYLIRRFVDANELLELQCLYAIQAHMNKLEFPSGILHTIIETLYESNIISGDAFLTWHDSNDPAEREGHSVAMVTLTSFFTALQEADDASSVEEAPTGADGC